MVHFDKTLVDEYQNMGGQLLFRLEFYDHLLLPNRKMAICQQVSFWGLLYVENL
jgi:hypothetical protein